MTEYSIQFDPRAEEDLEDAADWYNDTARGLGTEFVLEVDEVIEKI